MKVKVPGIKKMQIDSSFCAFWGESTTRVQNKLNPHTKRKSVVYNPI
jgi:hypothetical protein